MPFFWNVIAEQGQLYGNRNLQNKVNVKNIYKISYPGYNEILTGYADPILNPNLRLNNKNRNLLEFLNQQSRLEGKVVVFGSGMFSLISSMKKEAGYPSTPDIK